jgi:hypothetical protein
MFRPRRERRKSPAARCDSRHELLRCSEITAASQRRSAGKLAEAAINLQNR